MLSPPRNNIKVSNKNSAYKVVIVSDHSLVNTEIDTKRVFAHMLATFMMMSHYEVAHLMFYKEKL